MRARPQGQGNGDSHVSLGPSASQHPARRLGEQTPPGAGEDVPSQEPHAGHQESQPLNVVGADIPYEPHSRGMVILAPPKVEPVEPEESSSSSSSSSKAVARLKQKKCNIWPKFKEKQKAKTGGLRQRSPGARLGQTGSRGKLPDRTGVDGTQAMCARTPGLGQRSNPLAPPVQRDKQVPRHGRRFGVVVQNHAAPPARRGKSLEPMAQSEPESEHPPLVLKEREQVKVEQQEAQKAQEALRERAAAFVAEANEEIEVSSEDNDWTQVGTLPRTGPRVLSRAEADIPHVGGISQGKPQARLASPFPPSTGDSLPKLQWGDHA
ncbi:unnamed protein product [Symbiodinium natans]|uniref:Uncharacterized protein n=1 Tax=Symbiodinium natans TaxID=878477 RepID=A0A812M0Y1_9DINO|nr:unnamed protein product [Symbiodinium natans]